MTKLDTILKGFTKTIVSLEKHVAYLTSTIETKSVLISNIEKEKLEHQAEQHKTAAILLKLKDLINE